MINLTNALTNALNNAAQTDAPTPVDVDTLDMATETQGAILDSLIDSVTAQAVERANRMTARTWHTDMIVTRLIDPAYDIRMLTGDFADIELTFTRVEQCGLATVYCFEHYAYVGAGKVGNLKKLSFVFVLEVEKYDTGQKHPNGDPVKGVRYTATQYGKLDLKALRMSSNRGAIVKELERIGRKQKKILAGDMKVTLTQVELDTVAHFKRLGVGVAELLAARASDVSEFGIRQFEPDTSHTA